MIISHKHRYLFVEVPHTASHSISEQLVRHYDGQPILKKHANVTQFLGHASPAEKRYFKFATVRNPLDSVATEFEKLRSNHRGQFTNPAMLLENGGSVTKDHLREFNFIRDNQADFETFFRAFRDKLYNNWFLIGDQHFDRVLRLESLQEDFADVLRQLGLNQVEPIPHVNRTKGKGSSYLDYYTPAMYKLVARRYGPFLEKWGYGLPPEWVGVAVPKFSDLQFKALTGLAAFAATHFTLSPDHPVLHRAKRAVDLVTHRL